MATLPDTSSDPKFDVRGPMFRVTDDDFNDVYALTSNVPVSASSPYIGTGLNSGTFSQTAGSSEAIISGAATTDNSGAQIQDDVANYNLVAGMQIDFLARVKMSDATQQECLVGLCVIDTTLLDGTGTLAGGLTFSGGIGFYKPDDEANWYFFVKTTSVNVVVSGSIAVPVASVYDVLKFTVIMDPVNASVAQIIYSINGKGSTINTNSMAANTVFYAKSWSANSGDAVGTHTCTLDYWAARQQRFLP